MKNKLFANIITMLCLLLSFTINANEGASSAQFSYQGQPGETLTLKNVLTETRYNEEEVPDTCTRQVPYTENVCDYETQYRRECEDIPGHEVCHDVPHRECRDVTRYRRECHDGPSREECHREPGREVCHNRPSRQVCERTQAQRVCEQVNGRRVCRRIPGERVCRTVPGERVCNTTPGRRVCNTIPGRRICERVPYTDQECSTTTRNECHWEPSRQYCEDVPYQEYVCRDVTRYREETYACTRTVRTPYTVVVKKLTADVEFEFENSLENLKVDFQINLTKLGEVLLEVEDQSEQPVIVMVSKNIDVIEGSDEDRYVVKYQVSFADKAETLSPVSGGITRVNLERTTLDFTTQKVFNPSQLQLKVIINHKGQQLMNKVVPNDDYQLVNSDEQTKVVVDISELELSKLTGDYQITIELNVELEDEAINLDDEDLTKVKTVTKSFALPVVTRSVELSELQDMIFGYSMLSHSNKIKQVQQKVQKALKKAGINAQVDRSSIDLSFDGSATVAIVVNRNVTLNAIEKALSRAGFEVN